MFVSTYFIFKNPAISAHFARSRQSPVHHTWIRQILARFTARVLLRPGRYDEMRFTSSVALT
jgi:hypothetical protein